MLCLNGSAVRLAIVAASLVSSAIVAQGGDEVVVDATSAVAYVKSCRKSNGAFGPADQEYTDAAWNYPAVFTLQLLNEAIPQQDAILLYGLGYPQGHVGYGHWQFFHQHPVAPG